MNMNLIIPASNDLNIENTNIKTASGVTLDEDQKTLVGSVLDVSTYSATNFTCTIF
jgi:hypothetical protein